MKRDLKDFKRQQEWFNNQRKANKDISEFNRGFEYAMSEYENLILFGVSSSKLREIPKTLTYEGIYIYK